MSSFFLEIGISRRKRSFEFLSVASKAYFSLTAETAEKRALGVGLADFGHFGGSWETVEVGPVNLDGEDGIGFGDLMILCEQWLRGR